MFPWLVIGRSLSCFSTSCGSAMTPSNSSFFFQMALGALPYSQPSNGGWKNDPQTQYHIQTDEGPERYFRYQTISGQYRKEKRLEDGTVIGSYGWVDADGYLRLRDYIADNQGYRILKTKNVFVGKDRPIGDAIYTAKRTKPTAGKLAETPVPSSGGETTVPITPKVVVEVTTPAPPAKYVAVTRKPTTLSIYTTTELPYETITDKYTPLRGYTASHEPYVQILPNSEQSSTNRPISITATPSNIPAINSNDLDYTQDDIYKTQTPTYEEQYRNTYTMLNGPTYPIDRNGNSYTGYSTNKIGNGYDPQYPYYDGVAVTNDGFRYYLPRQYHEEQTLPGDTRTGSFGYIDPFGIRRVVYYNTAPGTGFQHKKNNRYVGFQATPYDPRPYRK